VDLIIIIIIIIKFEKNITTIKENS
jgi:hypothetical protein